MSQMLGQKQLFFFCIVFSVFTLTGLGFYLNSGIFFYTNLLQNNVNMRQFNGEELRKLYNSELSNSTSTNQSTSISKYQTTLASSFLNQSALSSQSSGNQTTVKTGNESQNLQGITKLNETANTKVKTEKHTGEARAPVTSSDKLKLPSNTKLLDTERKSKVETTDPLYTQHGYLSVLDQTKKLNLHCAQCAFVSSSGQLLKSGAGYLIDEADCVFRMNNAPASGYEEDVGSRTTVRVIAHSSTPHLKKNPKYLVDIPSPTEYVVGWGPPKALSTTGSGFAFNTLKASAEKYKKTGFFYLTQEQMNKADEIFEAETGVPRMKSGTHLSTGWFTMLLARNVCDEIHIYGMVNDQYCQNETNKEVPYHYYNTPGLKECDYYKKNEKGKRSVHRFMTEKAIFARWALEQPPMYFHTPFWNP
ncbi:alpha-N-acetylgalactosaminide alpha-2,6-sialyltransferase 3-like isoform X1 [Asterias amurensis]|uniref:alpha-N-acetylgalactosaminide alpha-2,6-sialyltransferase 3-like isoform X1 n=1 Tax=Asterias amurensis TaxID=7602 RepID=UPI003AB610AA